MSTTKKKRYRFVKGDDGKYLVFRVSDNRLLGTLRPSKERPHWQSRSQVRTWITTNTDGTQLRHSRIGTAGFRSRDDAAERLMDEAPL
jgi:hypothetical protein